MHVSSVCKRKFEKFLKAGFSYKYSKKKRALKETLIGVPISHVTGKALSKSVRHGPSESLLMIYAHQIPRIKIR